MTNSNQKTYIFHVRGMHCDACTLLIEETFKELPYVSRVHASLPNHQVTITGNFSEPLELIAEKLTELVKSHGYTASSFLFRQVLQRKAARGGRRPCSTLAD